jgi:hypothetical protein
MKDYQNGNHPQTVFFYPAKTLHLCVSSKGAILYAEN